MKSIFRLLLATGLLLPFAVTGHGAPRHGFNLVRTQEAPLGSEPAGQSLLRMRALGADAVAIVPFFWQNAEDAPDLVPGSDMSLDELRAGIRQAREAGFHVMVKPHVWVPESWAGAIAMTSEAGWRSWFANYADALAAVAIVAEEEGADSLSVGTELKLTTRRPEWPELIRRINELYSGPLVYMAHGADGAEKVPFWDRLDRLGVTLYPALGGADAPAWETAMQGEIERLGALAGRTGKGIWVGEIGLRSAKGATERPWESAEERAAPPDDLLQARVLGAWLEALELPFVEGVLIWRWFSDPQAGGPADTDFTVQGKLSEGMLFCRWRGPC